MEGRRRKPFTRDQLLGIANYLTYARIAVVPVVLLLMSWIDDSDTLSLSSNIALGWVSMILLTLAGFSDVVDGIYARRYGITSSFGKFLDPLADKLLTISVMVMLLKMGRIDVWFVVLLTARDVTITALRSMASAEGIEIAASGWGKKKTLMHMIALGFLQVHYPAIGLDPQRIGTILIWFTLAISLGSGLHYIWAFFSEVLEKKKQGG